MWDNTISSLPTLGKLSRRDLLGRGLAAGFSLGTAGILLQSCGGSTGSVESTLNFANWASAETATRENIDKALRAFENQNNVQINNIALPFDDVLTQLNDLIH